MRILTLNFCARLNELNRRIVVYVQDGLYAEDAGTIFSLRNDLRSFRLGQKGRISFVSDLILSL